MNTDPLMPRRSSPLATWLAVRSLLTGIVAVVVAVVLQSTALPRVAEESKGLSDGAAPALAWIPTVARVLPLVPAPAVVLAVAALMSRTFRGPLATLAALAAAVALVTIVGTLIAAMLPLYQMPTDMDVLQ